LKDREDERRKEKEIQDKDLKDKAEERFKTAVTALGDEKEGAQVGGAILLRSFLDKNDKSYERYYTQVFDLVVANLRLPRTSNPPEDPNTALPLTPLSQALITVFQESFPLAHKELKEREGKRFNPRSLNATGINLDKAFLWKADLEEIWMPSAFLRETDLSEAELQGVTCILDNLRGPGLSEAGLGEAILLRAILHKANFHKANLSKAKFFGADLTEANIEDSLSLKDTDLRGVTGLTKEQLEVCKAKGAIIDEDSTTYKPHRRLPLKGVRQLLVQVVAVLHRAGPVQYP
jgi:uncharacterized protein YjbI with pentapeptide repeats